MFLTEATVEKMEQLERGVINGHDDEIISFNSTLSSELSMIAVAVCMTRERTIAESWSTKSVT